MTTFQSGEWILLTTDKGKNWLFMLTPGNSFSCHLGTISHDDIIGRKEGERWETPKGTHIFFFRPTLTDFLFHIRRQTQIVYPKDIGALLCYGDIRPGMRVLESGVGSGALSLFLLSVIGSTGQLVSVEIRSEFAQLARNNIRRFLGAVPSQWEIVVSNIENPGIGGYFDRVILDLPEPWKAVSTAASLIKPGGIIISLSPQIIQIQATAQEMRRNGFRFIRSFEIIKRDWLVDERRTRPADRMIAHTGFLIFSRKVES